MVASQAKSGPSSVVNKHRDIDATSILQTYKSGMTGLHKGVHLEWRNPHNVRAACNMLNVNVVSGDRWHRCCYAWTPAEFTSSQASDCLSQSTRCSLFWLDDKCRKVLDGGNNRQGFHFTAFCKGPSFALKKPANDSLDPPLWYIVYTVPPRLSVLNYPALSGNYPELIIHVQELLIALLLHRWFVVPLKMLLSDHPTRW